MKNPEERKNGLIAKLPKMENQNLLKTGEA